MRLLDRILHEEFKSTLFGNTVQETYRRLDAAQLVVIDNVAAYHFADLKRRLNDNKIEAMMKASDFPNVMLPFETAFLEMRVRDNSSFTSTFEECGYLMEMHKPSKSNLERWNEEWHGEMADCITDLLLDSAVEYHMVCRFFVYSRKVGKPFWAASSILPITKEGRVFSTPNQNFPAMNILHDLTGITNDNDRENALWYLGETYLFPCLLGLSFMHCRNVKVIEEVPAPKLSRKWQKRSGKPLLHYRLLQIDHMQEILEKKGEVSSQGLKHALHICRGHFRHYGTDGKGLLFGKYAGTVFVPMHTRGSQEEGIVVKDYEVAH